MRFMKIAGICAITGLILGANALSAFASPFGVFKQGDGGASNPFTYNDSTSPNFNVLSIPVTFSYTVGNTYDGTNTDIAAHLTLKVHNDTSTTHGQAGQFDFQGMVFSAGDLLSITADTAKAGKSNLLTILAGSKGTLAGTDNTHNVALTGDTNHDPVLMSSDFVNLTGYNLSYNVSFNTIPTIAENGSNYITSFVATGSGEFGRDSVTPEGSALGMLSAAALPLAGIGLGLRRRKVSKN